MNTKCGILGYYNLTYDTNYNSQQFISSLLLLQHRGHDSFGFSWVNNSKIEVTKKLGLIKDSISELNLTITSKLFCGHTRYSTSGNSKNNTIENRLKEVQPLVGYNKTIGFFSLCHNGNIPNIENENLNDTQYIFKLLLECNDSSFDTIVIDILNTFKRAFNLIIMTIDTMYIIKDSYGTRPLCIGYNEDGYLISSESCALDRPFLREVKTGEIIKINDNKLETMYMSNTINKAHCLFEYIYFMDERSIVNNSKIYDFRYKCGEQLALYDNKYKYDNDNTIVVGAPKTGIASGKGYANYSKLNYVQVLKKNTSINRTFILENNIKRDKVSKLKYYIDDTIDIKDKTIIILDDSLVRGITLKNIITMFKERGVKEIHVRIASPPIYNPCFYGIDIPTKEELIVNNIDINSINEYFECDSLNYISLDIMKNILSKENNFCSGCFNGNYNDKLDW